MTSGEAVVDWLLRLLGGLAVLLGGWLWRKTERTEDRMDRLSSRIEHVDDRVDEMAIQAARDFIPRAEVTDMFRRIESKLDGIYSKLDQKVDK